MTRAKLLHSLVPLFGILLFSGALWVLHHELKAYHLQDIVRHLREIPAHRLLPALALTFLSYLIMTEYDILALRYVHHPLPYSKIHRGGPRLSRARSSHTTARTVPYAAVRNESDGYPRDCAVVSLEEALKPQFVEVAVETSARSDDSDGLNPESSESSDLAQMHRCKAARLSRSGETPSSVGAPVVGRRQTVPDRTLFESHCSSSCGVRANIGPPMTGAAGS